MANYYSLCLLGAMDRLWFHQIILFSETVSDQKTPETSKPNSVSLAYSSLLDEGVSSDISLLADEEILSDSSPISPTVLKHILVCVCVVFFFFFTLVLHLSDCVSLVVAVTRMIPTMKTQRKIPARRKNQQD